MSTHPGFRAFHVTIAAVGGFALSFEEAEAALGRIARLYFEPDGAFVWAGDGWQVDGVVYDREGRIQYLEIKGTAPVAELEQLLRTLGWPGTPLVFQLIRQGQELDEAAFWRWLNEA